MISPTPGRVVWVRNASDRALHQEDQPLAALVTYVHSDREVNLAVFDVTGAQHGVSNVQLVQDGDPVPEGIYAEWMPYQKGQAAKTEALEAQSKPAAA